MRFFIAWGLLILVCLGAFTAFALLIFAVHGIYEKVHDVLKFRRDQWVKHLELQIRVLEAENKELKEQWLNLPPES